MGNIATQHWEVAFVKEKISLLVVGIDFVGGSRGSGSDLSWPRQIEDRCRLFQPPELFRSFPGFRPQPEGELEERPGVDRQLRRRFAIRSPYRFRCYVR